MPAEEAQQVVEEKPAAVAAESVEQAESLGAEPSRAPDKVKARAKKTKQKRFQRLRDLREASVPPDHRKPEADQTEAEPEAPEPVKKPAEAAQKRPVAETSSMASDLREMGVSDENLERMAPEQMAVLLGGFDQRLIKLAQERAAQTASSSSGDAPPADPASPSAPTLPDSSQVLSRPAPERPNGQGASPPKTTAEFGIELDEQVHGPEIVGAFRAMQDHFKGQVAAQSAQLQKISAMLGDVVTHLSASRAAQRAEQFDVIASKLDPELYGEGRSARLGVTSEAFKNRKALAETADQLEQSIRLVGLQPPDMDSLLRRAHMAHFGDYVIKKAEQSVYNKLREQERDQAGRFVGRASRSGTKEEPEDPRQAGIAKVRAFRAARGLKD